MGLSDLIKKAFFRGKGGGGGAYFGESLLSEGLITGGNLRFKMG